MLNIEFSHLQYCSSISLPQKAKPQVKFAWGSQSDVTRFQAAIQAVNLPEDQVVREA
jgi:hypothetical protein